MEGNPRSILFYYSEKVSQSKIVRMKGVMFGQALGQQSPELSGLLLSGQAKIQICGDRIPIMFQLVCPGSLYSPPTRGKRNLIPRRIVRGVTEECCSHSCTWSTLLKYCDIKKPSLPSLPATPVKTERPEVVPINTLIERLMNFFRQGAEVTSNHHPQYSIDSRTDEIPIPVIEFEEVPITNTKGQDLEMNNQLLIPRVKQSESHLLQSHLHQTIQPIKQIHSQHLPEIIFIPTDPNSKFVDKFMF